jgi:hypothetical protein
VSLVGGKDFEKTGRVAICLTILWGKAGPAECLSELYSNICHVYVHVTQTIIKRMDSARKKFFWQGSSTKKKYYLVKWIMITRPKNKEGLGVKDLIKMNISLLCKWWWKFESREGLWQEIARKKYKIRGGINKLKYNPANSPLWNSIIKIKKFYLAGRKVVIGNGRTQIFGETHGVGHAL